MHNGHLFPEWSELYTKYCRPLFKGTFARERHIGMESHLSSIAAFQSIMDPIDRPQNESHGETFDPGVLEIESFLTEEQEARLLAEYCELINEDLFEDENVDEVL
jgi:hypothetical protein